MFRTEVKGVLSESKQLDRGCVQGSVLGPRLFSMYVGELEQFLKSIDANIQVVSYADDTYVLVTTDNLNDIVPITENVIEKHVGFLKDLGMVVNESKTEIMWIGPKTESTIASINVCGVQCNLVDNMKALGIMIDGNLKWNVQAECAIAKGQRLLSVFKHLRKYMTESQFLKAVTANYYSTVFYGASVWLPNIKAIHMTKLQSLHFRLLRSACRDYYSNISRHDLTRRCKRATPSEWAKYTTSSIAIKIVRDAKPKYLHETLMRTYYSERRNVARGLFFDSSKTRVGRQSLENRLAHVAQIKEPWNTSNAKLTNDQLRVMLKHTYFFYFFTTIVSITDCAPLAQ